MTEGSRCHIEIVDVSQLGADGQWLEPLGAPIMEPRRLPGQVSIGIVPEPPHEGDEWTHRFRFAAFVDGVEVPPDRLRIEVRLVGPEVDGSEADAVEAPRTLTEWTASEPVRSNPHVTLDHSHVPAHRADGPVADWSVDVSVLAVDPDGPLAADDPERHRRELLPVDEETDPDRAGRRRCELEPDSEH